MTDLLQTLTIVLFLVTIVYHQKMLSLHFKMLETMHEGNAAHVDITSGVIDGCARFEARLKCIEQKLDIKPKPG